VSRLVASAGRVVTSNLRRCVESAAWLAPSADIQIDPELREAALPDSLGTSVRMWPGPRIVLARLAWWLNWRQSVEPVRGARQRARQAAERLCSLAREHRSVAVVGHGIFNRFIARQLSRRGWCGPAILPTAHWAIAKFTLGDPAHPAHPASPGYPARPARNSSTSTMLTFLVEDCRIRLAS
jgi:broad specificity phosphatase PhoE